MYCFLFRFRESGISGVKVPVPLLIKEKNHIITGKYKQHFDTTRYYLRVCLILLSISYSLSNYKNMATPNTMSLTSLECTAKLIVAIKEGKARREKKGEDILERRE